MSEQINNIIGTTVENVIKQPPLQPQPNQTKLNKRTDPVLKVINDFFIIRFKPSDESLKKWNTYENQYKIRLLINEKKFKCKKEEDDEETILRKQKRKEKKKDEKVVKKAEKQINKLKGRPKSACFYFIQDEKPNVLLDHPEWNNKEHKGEIYLELQNRWKITRLTNKLEHYNKIAEDTYKNMPIPIKKPFVPYDRDVRNKNSLIGTVAPDGKMITKYNKNKYNKQESDCKSSLPKFVDIKYINSKPRFVDNRNNNSSLSKHIQTKPIFVDVKYKNNSSMPKSDLVLPKFTSNRIINPNLENRTYQPRFVDVKYMNNNSIPKSDLVLPKFTSNRINSPNLENRTEQPRFVDYRNIIPIM